MSKQSVTGLGVRRQPDQQKAKQPKLPVGRVWITLDGSALGLRIKNGNKGVADIKAGRYQAMYVEHPISPGRSTLKVFDNEQDPAYLVVQTLPGQGVNLIIEDELSDNNDVGIPK